MLILLLGLAIFLTNHSVRLAAPGWREGSIAEYGEKTWKLLYSLFAVVGLVLIVYGYGLSRADPVFVWNPPLATRHVAVLFVWLAFILLAAAHIKGNHFKAKLGHPMYAGVKLWAFAHLIANGRLGDILLFGTFLIWAIAGFNICRRRDRLAGVVPPAGNNRQTVITVVAGTVAWALFTFWLHRVLIGVPPIAM